MKKASKSDIVNMVAARTGEKKDLTAKMVTETLTAIRALMISGDPEIKISLHDFGVFEVKKRRRKVKSLSSLIESGAVNFSRRAAFYPGKYLKAQLRRVDEK